MCGDILWKLLFDYVIRFSVGNVFIGSIYFKNVFLVFVIFVLIWRVEVLYIGKKNIFLFCGWFGY